MEQLNNPQSRSKMMPFLALAIIRFISPFFLRGTIHPDQYYQGSEVAYAITFPTDQFQFTWEWSEQFPLRSIVQFLPSLGVFQIVKLLHLDFTFVIKYLNGWVQASFALISDYYFWKLVKLLAPGHQAAKIMVETMLDLPQYGVYLMNHTINDYSVKPLGITLISQISIISLYYFARFQLKQEDNSLLRAFFFASLTCIIRPYVVIFWFQFLYLLLGSHQSRLKLSTFIKLGAISVLQLAFQILVDSLAYKKLTLTFYNFIYLNYFLSTAGHFGGNSNLFFYLLQGNISKLGVVGFLWLLFCLLKCRMTAKGEFVDYLVVSGLMGQFILGSLYHKQPKFDFLVTPWLVLKLGYTLAGTIDSNGIPCKVKLLLASMWAQSLLLLFIFNYYWDNASETLSTLQSELSQAEGIQSVYFNFCFYPIFTFFHPNNIKFVTPECLPPFLGSGREMNSQYLAETLSEKIKSNQITEHWLVTNSNFLNEQDLRLVSSSYELMHTTDEGIQSMSIDELQDHALRTALSSQKFKEEMFRLGSVILFRDTHLIFRRKT